MTNSTLQFPRDDKCGTIPSNTFILALHTIVTDIFRCGENNVTKIWDTFIAAMPEEQLSKMGTLPDTCGGRTVTNHTSNLDQ